MYIGRPKNSHPYMGNTFAYKSGCVTCGEMVSTDKPIFDF